MGTRSSFTTEALLLKSLDRGEDDRLLTLLCPDLGRVTALALHARGSRRRFGAALQPFCLFEAALRPGDGGLFFLNSAAILETPLGPGAGFEAMAAAWLCLDVAEAFAVEGQAQALPFELLLGGLRRLKPGGEAPEAVRQSVLWGSLEQAGWAPELESCIVCASKGPWARLGLEPGKGGLLCGACLKGGEAALPGGALGHLRDLAAGLPVGPAPAGVEAALLRWTEYHVGRALHSAAFLGVSAGVVP